MFKGRIHPASRSLCDSIAGHCYGKMAFPKEGFDAPGGERGATMDGKAGKGREWTGRVLAFGKSGCWSGKPVANSPNKKARRLEKL